MEKERIPLYKKWWIWLIVVIILIAIATGDDESDTAVEEDKSPVDQAKDTPKESTEKQSSKEQKPAKPIFTMRSNDVVGATTHTVVGGDFEPSGTYVITATSGHGTIIINDGDLHVLAADEYEGEEYSGLTYERSITLELNGNDIIKARNYNSSKFKIDFVLK